MDAALPFGLRSAPLIFTALADATQWIMTQRGIAEEDIDHYIDDFVTLGAPDSPACQENRDIMHSTMRGGGPAIRAGKR